MHARLTKTALLGVALLFRVTTIWSQTPTPSCSDDTWTPTSTANAPTSRQLHTAIWTGNEMIVWGGNNGVGNIFFNTGGKYDPSADSWTATSTANAPTGRFGHTAVWTGSEMIVWGGYDGNLAITGGRYNPGTDSWIATSTASAPSARGYATTVWTGTEMIVWGGVGGSPYSEMNTGARYNPMTDTWTATSISNAPSSRQQHTAIWTGNEMIVWGGYIQQGTTRTYLNTGGRYNPTTDSWTTIDTANAPIGRQNHTAVWTGDEMIVWGGLSDNGGYLISGGRYNPTTNTWTATMIFNTPGPRAWHTAVWTASEMIVWGGYATIHANAGGRYNPGTDSWTVTSTTSVPAGVYDHTAIWTGSEMIVWGGDYYDGAYHYVNTGGRYCAQPEPAPSETPTPTPAPTPTPSGTPTATPPVNISGTISYCSNPTTEPVPNVTLAANGDVTTTTMTDAVGNYMLSLPAGGSYTVTPSKTGLRPGSSSINTIDVVATQRHFLNIALLSACRLMAADVNGDNAVNTVDVVAIQRFFLGLTTGIGNSGTYNFTPISRAYLNVFTDQTAQNYDALIFGDVASPFVEP